MILDHKNLPADVKKFEERLMEQNEEVRSRIEELEKKLVNIPAASKHYQKQREQEVAHIRCWREYLASSEPATVDGDRKLLAIINEKLEALSKADVDPLDLPVVDPGTKQLNPVTPLAEGIRTQPLQAAMEAASRGHKERQARRIKSSGGWALLKLSLKEVVLCGRAEQLNLQAWMCFRRSQTMKAKKSCCLKTAEEQGRSRAKDNDKVDRAS